MAMVNQGLELSDLQAGQRVKIHGVPGQARTLVACSISIKEPDEVAVIEGPIEYLDSDRHTLRILGLELLVPPHVQIQNRARSQVTLTSLEVGDVAKLKGTCAPTGGFVVSSIKLQPTESTLLAEVQGRIDSVDPRAGTLHAVGVTVVVTADTAINDFPESASKTAPSFPPTAAPLQRSSDSASLLALDDEYDGSTAAPFDLSHYLRMPIRGGPRLTRADTNHTGSDASTGRSSDRVECLIDRVNTDVLASLLSTTPGPAYLLAFVSGSPVRNRLQGTRSGWHRLEECLNLDAITRDLERSFAPLDIERLLGKLRRSTEAQLLLAESRMGPAKLLFRRRGMDENVLLRAGYNDIERLVSEMALLASDCDEDTKSLLRDAGIGKSAPALRRRLHVLLRRFDLNDSLASSDRFDEFVRVQKDTGCLHPAFPVSIDVVRRVADVLAVSDGVANRVIILFRFAWLCGEETADGVSDFAIKSLVVIPHAGSCGRATDSAGNVLEQMCGTLLRVTREHTSLSRFRETYPDARIEIAAQAVAMPRPLFDLFSSIDGPDERRLDFLTRYRLGPEPFMRYVAEQSDVLTRGRLSLSDAPLARLPAVDLRLFEDVVFLSAKEGKKRAKRGRVESLGVSTSMLRDSLERMLSSGDDADVNEWSWRLNEISKCDVVGRIRGVWAVKHADV